MPNATKNVKQSILERKARYVRIIEALKDKGLSTVQAKIGASLYPKVSQGGVGGWKGGRTTPSPEHLSQIADMTGWSFDYIWSGRGSKKPSISPDLGLLLEIWRDLSDKDRKEVLLYAEFRKAINTD